MGPALLQLLGWFGFLGVGYVVVGHMVLGAAMLLGWWATFWTLLFYTEVTRALDQTLAAAIWVGVPSITSLALWLEIGGAP